MRWALVPIPLSKRLVRHLTQLHEIQQVYITGCQHARHRRVDNWTPVRSMHNKRSIIQSRGPAGCVMERLQASHPSGS